MGFFVIMLNRGKSFKAFKKRLRRLKIHSI